MRVRFVVLAPAVWKRLSTVRRQPRKISLSRAVAPHESQPV